MTKNKFLKELDKSLYVLAEVERKDIINEYRDIIEEKVKHGKSEKEAVEEFGSIEELSREILSAYKVNPDYHKKDDDLTESAKKLGSDFDHFVKKSAKKATEFSKELVAEIQENNDDITIEFVFELLFKAIATLIIMFIASLPFMFIRELGSNILDVVIYPINKILIFIWSLFVTVLFIGCCLLIFIAMFKQYFNKKKGKDDSERKETEVLAAKSKPETKDKAREQETTLAIPSTKDSSSKNLKVKKQKGTSLLDIFLAIAKAVMVVMLIPLILFNITIMVGIVITIYIMVKGLMVPGILILLIGVLTFFGYLQMMMFNVIFRQKKIYFYPYVIGIILGIVGGILCFDQAINMNYYDQEPKMGYQVVTTEKKITFPTKDVFINYWGDGNYYDNVSYVTDDTLKDNEILLQVQHKKELNTVNIELEPYGYIYDENGNVISQPQTTETTRINIYASRTNYLSKYNKEVRAMFIKNFKENKIYNYTKLYTTDLVIITNSKTKESIQNLDELVGDDGNVS